MIKFLGPWFCLFWIVTANAGDCLEYKNIPRIIINVPDWEKTVVQPIQPLNLYHGNVVATLVENLEIITDVKKIDDGFCVALKTVNAEIGYNQFDVQIDIRHKPNSCQYNAVLEHEDKHIDTYLKVVENHKVDLHKAVYTAADSVMPVFVKSQDDVDVIVNQMHDSIIMHPDFVLIKQKIHAAEEIENKQVDVLETGADLKKCG